LRIILILILQFVFITYSIIPSVTVLADENINVEDEPAPRISDGLFKWAGYKFGYIWASIFMIIQFVTSTGAADPPYIEIGYNETIAVDVGLLDLTTGEFENVLEQLFILNTRFLNFEVIKYPGGNSTASSWNIYFDPNSITYDVGNTMKTKAYISLTAPPVAENAIQSGVLTIKVKDYWVYRDTWLPHPDSAMGQTLVGKLIWFFGAITAGYGVYSGTVNLEPFDIHILVKVKPYHAIKFETIPLVHLEPNEIKSVPITIENIGNYNDTFNFKIAEEDSKNIIIANPISITLAPGESKETFLGISVEPSMFDLGTLHQVKIEAYSVNEPDVTISTRTILLETKGLFINEGAGVTIGSFTLLILLGIGFYLYQNRKRFESFFEKLNSNNK